MNSKVQKSSDESREDLAPQVPAAGYSRRDFLVIARNVGAAAFAACGDKKEKPDAVPNRVSLRGGAEYVVRERMHIIYLPESLVPDIIVRSVPAAPLPADGNFTLACAGPFFDSQYKIVGRYVLNGQPMHGELVDYINAQFAQGFFAVGAKGQWHISSNSGILEGARMGFEQFLIIENGKLAGELPQYVGTDKGGKFLRRYLCEFEDGSFAVIEVVSKTHSKLDSAMTHANAGDYLLKNAKSKSGAALKNALYLDMGIASAALVQEADGTVVGLPCQKGENRPASFLVFKN